MTADRSAQAALRGPAPAGFPPTLGAALRRAREERCLSQRAVARRLGRPHSIVSRWEAGIREPTLLDLGALGRVLGFSPDDLVAHTTPAPGGRRWSSRAHPRRRREMVGGRLRAARLAEGHTIRALRAATGISGERLLAIESGADPGIRELRALRSALGISLDEILAPAGVDRTPAPPTTGYQTAQYGARPQDRTWISPGKL
jgi:transcriptional regulator with XRE-family HTH domain